MTGLSRNFSRGFGVVCLLALLAGCSKPAPPVGRWEGGAEQGGVMVAARVQVLDSGGVRVMAPDVTNAIGSHDEMVALQSQLAAELANGWPDVKPRIFDFDGDTFRKPGGIAPQMKWDKATNQMTLELYIGTKPALPIVLRPVAEFHDSPFGAG